MQKNLGIIYWWNGRGYWELFYASSESAWEDYRLAKLQRKEDIDEMEEDIQTEDYLDEEDIIWF